MAGTEKQAKFPNKVEDLIEYFTKREQEGMTISVAKGLRAALAFLERAAGLELKDRLVSKQLFVNFYEEQLTRLMPGRILGQAPRPLLMLLGSLEFFVHGSSGSPFCRAFAWWKLVQAWGVMRHSDHEGFAPRDGDKFMVDSGSITATLTKTKRRWRQDPSMSLLRRGCCTLIGSRLVGAFFQLSYRRIVTFCCPRQWGTRRK